MNPSRARRASLSLTALVAAALLLAACATPPTATPNEAPLAIFSPSSSTGAAPFTVTFDASAAVDPDGQIVSWTWDFGDGTSGAGVVVDKSFPAGQFTVTLSVTDNSGATSSSSTVITSVGLPEAPTGLTKTGSGCCNTYGDFAWNPVPGVTQYQIEMDGRIGCLTNHSATIAAPASTGRVQAVGLCLGSQYDVRIRAMTIAGWGPWSTAIRITL